MLYDVIIGIRMIVNSDTLYFVALSSSSFRHEAVSVRNTFFDRRGTLLFLCLIIIITLHIIIIIY